MKLRLALALMLPLLMAAPTLAVTRVHGIVQDDHYAPVPGGMIRLEHEYDGHWYIEYENPAMQGHSFGWDLTKAGEYRVSWSKSGYAVDWIRSGEFTLATAPFGDIVVYVRRVTEPAPTATPEASPTPWPTFRVPTTLMPPTVDPTATPGGWTAAYGVVSWFGTWSYGADALRNSAPQFLQLSLEWQWNVIEKARQEIGGPLGSLMDVKDDPLWLSGADMELGAQLTPRFEVGPYEAMGFAQAIVVRER